MCLSRSVCLRLGTMIGGRDKHVINVTRPQRDYVWQDMLTMAAYCFNMYEGGLGGGGVSNTQYSKF